MSAPAAAGPWLAARDVCKRYPGVVALDGASIEMHAGSVEALIGKNGAGKSTLIKIITGAETPDSGVLTIAGQTFSEQDVRGARERRVFVVRQEMELFPELSVTEKLLLPDRLPRWGKRILWSLARSRAREALSRLGLDVDPDRLVRNLSVPARRSVMIAQALVREPRALILDEPTEAFTEAEVARLFEVVRVLTREGVAVLYVSHRLTEVLEISDHITVLRDGRTVAEMQNVNVDRAQLVEAITGSQAGKTDGVASGYAEKSTTRRRVSSATATGPLLVAKDLSRTRIRHVSLTVGRGEVVGLYGLTGSGRSELLRVVAGALRQHTGELEFDGQAITGWDFRRRRRAGVVFLAEDRATDGLLSGMTIRENVAVGSKSAGSRLRPRRLQAYERQLALAGLSAVGLQDVDLNRLVSTLSGGNQQKVLFARSITSGARLWLLDEPTTGLDVAARADLFSTLRRAVRGELPGAGSGELGGALVALSDYGDLAALVDRVYVLRAGLVGGELHVEGISEDRLLHAASFAGEDSAGVAGAALG